MKPLNTILYITRVQRFNVSTFQRFNVSTLKRFQRFNVSTLRKLNPPLVLFLLHLTPRNIHCDHHHRLHIPCLTKPTSASTTNPSFGAVRVANQTEICNKEPFATPHCRYCHVVAHNRVTRLHQASCKSQRRSTVPSPLQMQSQLAAMDASSVLED
mgnify:CR=1 FL=1